LLSLGLKICLIEKRNVINDVSKAVGVNDECLLAWKICGIWDKISNYIGFNEEGEVILKYLDVKKREILALYQSFGSQNLPKGVVILQSKIDETLLYNLHERADVCFDEELIDISQNCNFIIASTKKKIYKAKYLIASDGKESAVRKIFGIKNHKMSESKDEWLILNLLVKNNIVTKKFVEVFCGSTRSLVSCPLPQNHHRLEISLLKSECDILCDENKIRKIIAPYLDFKNYQILNKTKIRFTTAIAEKYYYNRVMLCGDSAHCTSPFASAGLVSGIRDCLVLYEMFKKKSVDPSLYQKSRYKEQISSLKLAMKLEKVMRPNKFIEKFLFFLIRFSSKFGAFVSYFSIRS
jgi:3-(3-hydroxy-phenyl)propionate hydroxylase